MSDVEPETDWRRGAPTREPETPAEPKPFALPEFVRKAIVAQGKVDPDEVAAAAAVVDLEAFEAEQLRLEAEARARRQSVAPAESGDAWWNR